MAYLLRLASVALPKSTKNDVGWSQGTPTSHTNVASPPDWIERLDVYRPAGMATYWAWPVTVCNITV